MSVPLGRVAAVCMLIACAACSGGATSTTASTTGPTGAPSTPVSETADVPLVGEIMAAVEALEAELGRPQEYFEINATAQLINIWIALNDGAVAQPWVWLDGALTAGEGQSASGNRFSASALTFDPALLLATVAVDLPTSALDAVEIVGGPDGTVRYTVVTTSPVGGQLLVVVGADGAILSVEAT